jgi:hypothetical protein
MTTAIPAGTRNITINVAEAEARILHRIAFDEDRSRGSLLRRAWLAYLKENYPREASEIEVARKALKACGLFAAGLWIVWQGIAGGMDAERRAGRFRTAGHRITQEAERLQVEEVTA